MDSFHHSPIAQSVTRKPVENLTYPRHYDQASLGAAGHAKLSTHVLDASNFAGFERGVYDAVVCNGVTMYFPSASYLLNVLTNGLARVTSGGTFHLGDIISLDAHPLFVLRSARLVGGSTFEQLQDQALRTELMEAAKVSGWGVHVYAATSYCFLLLLASPARV